MLTLTGVLMIASCGAFSPSDASLPLGAVAMVAPAEYHGWFQKTEVCSGLSRDIQSVQWYVVPGVETFATDAGPKVGVWERTGGTARIIIAGHWVHHEMAVRHEMLHHLLDREGHPQEYFVERCHLTWESWGSLALAGASR